MREVQRIQDNPNGFPGNHLPNGLRVRKPVRGQMPQVDCRLVASQNFTHELPGDRPETDSHHGMPGCDGEIGMGPGSADEWETIGRHGAKSNPRLDPFEVLRLEAGHVLRNSLDDP